MPLLKLRNCNTHREPQHPRVQTRAICTEGLSRGRQRQLGNRRPGCPHERPRLARTSSRSNSFHSALRSTVVSASRRSDVSAIGVATQAAQGLVAEQFEVDRRYLRRVLPKLGFGDPTGRPTEAPVTVGRHLATHLPSVQPPLWQATLIQVLIRDARSNNVRRPSGHICDLASLKDAPIGTVEDESRLCPVAVGRVVIHPEFFKNWNESD